MTTASLTYKQTGIQRLSGYKDSFLPNENINTAAVSDFVNLFCEYQLADNNYMDVHLQASANSHKEEWFSSLTTDQVLRFITYIIWTDKFSEGYITSKVKDKTMYHLLCRLEELQSA